MSEGSDTFKEAHRLVENPDYYEIFDTVVHFESAGMEMEFSLDEVEISISGDEDERGVIQKGPAKIVVSLDGRLFGDYRVWRVTPSEKVEGVDSLTVEKRVMADA